MEDFYRNITFGGGATASLLHPIALVMLVVCLGLIFVLPLKKVVVPVLVMFFLLPQNQQFFVAGIHLFLLRIIIIAALIRLVGTRMAGGWNSIDTAFTVWVLAQAIATLLSYSGAFFNQGAFVLDCLGGYIVFRKLMQDEESALTAIRSIAVIAFIVGVNMIYENVTLVNNFGLMGGTRATPEIREGSPRSQGPFQHALTAGAFGATALPLIYMMWKRRVSRGLAAFGIFGSTAMTMSTATSTSLLSFFAVLLAVLAWPLRSRMRQIRWGFVGVVGALSLVMSAPVWFIIARIDLTGSSSSYQRAALIDAFVNNVDKWWLLGSNTSSWGWDMWDAQNWFVSSGAGGGLLAFVAFVMVMKKCFWLTGDAMKKATNVADERMFWLLGGTLFVDLVTFMGVNFFDQVREIYFLLIAIIIALTLPSLATDTVNQSAANRPLGRKTALAART
jgi:hypothetical protein